MDKTTYGLFVRKKQVWQTETDERDEQRYEGAWPVTIWLTAQDYHDGLGWGREVLGKMVKIHEYYLHNVGNGYESYAVLVTVPDEETFVKLVPNRFEPWHGNEPPAVL